MPKSSKSDNRKATSAKKKSWFESHSYAKINTKLLLYLYQIFIFFPNVNGIPFWETHYTCCNVSFPLWQTKRGLWWQPRSGKVNLSNLHHLWHSPPKRWRDTNKSSQLNVRTTCHRHDLPIIGWFLKRFHLVFLQSF